MYTFMPALQCLVIATITGTFTQSQSPVAQTPAGVPTSPYSQTTPAPSPLGMLLPRINIGPKELSAAGVSAAEAQAAFVATSENAAALLMRLSAADQAVLASEASRKQAEHRIRVGLGTPADCFAVKQVNLASISKRHHREAVLAEASAVFLAAIPASKRAELGRIAGERARSNLQSVSSLRTQVAMQSSAGEPASPTGNTASIPDPALTAAWRQAIVQAR